MKMAPSISVIVTVYNRFELTKHAVESVLSQTLPVSEIILLDDGSFDGTSDLLQRHLAENGRWSRSVRYVHQENQGPGAARNRGIAEANGDWLAFIDNDDLWLPQKLEWQFHALDQFEHCDACITDAWFMNNPYMKMTLFQLAGKEHSGAIGVIADPPTYMLDTKSIVGVHPIWLQNLVTRAHLARAVGGFDPSFRFGDDDDFAFRLGCAASFCFVNVPMVLIDRTPPAQRHVGANERWDEVDFRLEMAQARYEKRLHASDQLSASVRKLIRRNLAAVHSEWANLYLEQHQYEKAREAAADAARTYLTPNLALKWALTRSTPGIARKVVLARNVRRSGKTAGIA
jgi:glycosyltransferase involved in cell wall biosynthesis